MVVPIEKHPHLDYCLACEKLLHPLGDLFKCITECFFVCSPECRDVWKDKPTEERANIVVAERKRKNGF